MEEVAWVVDNWKNLKRLRGFFNRDSGGRQLKREIESLDIEI
jgi:hypothetical protein